jgi:hypothetical protein
MDLGNWYSRRLSKDCVVLNISIRWIGCGSSWFYGGIGAMTLVTPGVLSLSFFKIEVAALTPSVDC